MAMLTKIMWRKYKKTLVASIVVIYLSVTATVMLAENMIVTFGESKYSDYLMMSLTGPLKYDDPALVKYIANEILVPPSTIPYHLKTFDIQTVLNKNRINSEHFYKGYLKGIFNLTKNGFFVEAGALDGETLSNTLWLEKIQGWTGLLVEPDPSNFIALKSKNRKAWSANACLSIKSYPKVEILTTMDNTLDVMHKAMGGIVNGNSNFKGIQSDNTFNSYYKSQCFPLGSFLLALNVTKIDLLSLDVEFVEERILRNFDFERFDVQVLFIEFYDYARQADFHQFLESKGFEFIANKNADVIYCKKGTELSARLSQLYPTRTYHIKILGSPPLPNSSMKAA